MAVSKGRARRAGGLRLSSTPLDTPRRQGWVKKTKIFSKFVDFFEIHEE
jgi:hypothetical protein